MAGPPEGTSTTSDSVSPEKGRGHTWNHLVRKHEIFIKTVGSEFMSRRQILKTQHGRNVLNGKLEQVRGRKQRRKRLVVQECSGGGT